MEGRLKGDLKGDGRSLNYLSYNDISIRKGDLAEKLAWTLPIAVKDFANFHLGISIFSLQNS